ncbi:MAG: sugar phosphate isomerase/epimerase [Novosphingobium sp.]|nr:sugar phosphate isomerase/epimerase [Novosphingobium sp.]
MKIGMNMLLWTGHVTRDHAPILKAIRDTGFDGVEVPVFDVSDEGHYRELGAMLDDLGLERTVVGLIPDEAHNPLVADSSCRARAIDHLKRVIDCTAALGGQVLSGPWYQPLGVFTGDKPSDDELDRCAEMHRAVAPNLRDAGIIGALELLNRFECYLLNTCEQGIAYAQRLGEAGIGIHYDTFHANIEEKDPVAAVTELHASGHLKHVHISENDRGTPGRGQARIRETIHALKALGYDDWLTIESFGRAVPELAAATRVWRDFFASPEEVYTEGFAYIRECWDEGELA